MEGTLIHKLILNSLTGKYEPAVQSFDEIDSTNQYLKRLVASGGQNEPLIVVAESQTAGYGKRGRSFYSPKKTGIYMSTLIPNVEIPLNLVGRVTIGVAVSVMAAIQKFFPSVELTAKWVNDILANNRKAVGILAELVDNPSGQADLIVGIGINLSTQNFPEELKNKAGSIAGVSKQVERERLVAQIYLEFVKVFSDFKNPTIIANYRHSLGTIGKEVEVRVGSKIIRGIARDIDDDGSLVVELNDGELRHLASGDVVKVNTPNSNYYG